MPKLAGALDGSLFLAPNTERPAPKKRSQRRGKTGGFVDGIVGGERVLIATPKTCKPREKGIEIQIRAALASAGIMVMRHHIDRRSPFGMGLGLGVADLICVVPPYGRFLAIECKRPGYSPSAVRPDQVRWMSVVRRYNGIAGIATSVEEAFELIDRARRLP